MALERTSRLPCAVLPKGVPSSNQVLDSRKSSQVTFPSAGAVQGSGRCDSARQNNDDAFLFSERLNCNRSVWGGSCGTSKVITALLDAINTLLFTVKGAVRVGVMERVPLLRLLYRMF